MAEAPHVIVLEDEVLIAMSFQDALEDGGFRVSLATHGAEALEIDARDAADALVTDLRMDGIGGREVIARLRETRPRLPAVVVSGFTGELAETDFDGPTKVLSKPLKPQAICDCLTELMGGG